MLIQVLNWDNFQLRKDVKSSSWFRFEHNFFIDHKFFTLDNDEKIVWLNILCTASIESKSEIEYNLKLASRLTNVAPSKIEKTLKKLQEFQCVKLLTRTRNVHGTHTCLQTDRQTDRQTEDFYTKIVDLWNRNVDDFGLAKIKVLNTQRKKKLIAACKIFKSLDDWKKIFTIAATKGFTAKDGSVFTPNWDYVFRNDNYLKFYEEHESQPIQQDSKQVIKNIEQHLLKELNE